MLLPPLNAAAADPRALRTRKQWTLLQGRSSRGRNALGPSRCVIARRVHTWVYADTYILPSFRRNKTTMRMMMSRFPRRNAVLRLREPPPLRTMTARRRRNGAGPPVQRRLMAMRQSLPEKFQLQLRAQLLRSPEQIFGTFLSKKPSHG